MQSKPGYHVVRLRHHDPKLLESLEMLHRALRAYHNSNPQTEQFMDFVTKRLTDETMLLVFSLAGDTPIGYGLAFDVAEHTFMPHWQRSGYITQLFVASEHRRQGAGQLLLDFIIRWLASRGVTNVLLNVSVENTVGDHFWQTNGFTPHLIRMKRAIP